MTNEIKIISSEEYLKTHDKMQDQEKVWDKISDLWNEYRKKPFDAIVDFLRTAISDSSESVKSKNAKDKIRVIDIGCGNGRNMIANENLEYYGVDFSENQIKAAENFTKDLGINAKLFKMNAFDLDKKVFKNEMFDYGLCIAVLHCVDDKKKRLNTLNELYRVLKKHGEALITVWNSEDNRFRGMKGDIFMSWRKDGKDHYRYYYLYDKKEFLDLLESVGFKIIKINDIETDRFSKKNWIVLVKK